MSDAPETLTICRKHDLDNIVYGGCECHDVEYYVRKDIKKSYDDKIEMLLQPAKDAMKAWGDYVNGSQDYLDSSTPWKALKEILERADK